MTTAFPRADAVASLIVVGQMLHAAWGMRPPPTTRPGQRDARR
ncbi:UNVERIFIED_ORG: hypothetical protein ABID57_003704 [Arthrobacter sp. UYEF1]